MTDKILDTLARTLWGEARGESDKGVIAVAWTIRNRVDIDLHDDGKPDWWGEGYEMVCLKPWQFSAWNRGDPNYPYLMGLKAIPAREYVRMHEIATSVVNGHEPDPTGGATHYHTKNMRKYPKWTVGATVTVTIGGHIFYKDVP